MKIAVFYYTQSGQARKVAESICSGMTAIIVYKAIVPQQSYPFPWGRKAFFSVFPETRLGLPPSGIEPIDLTDVLDADLTIVVGQSWFLSPSLPLQSFFADGAITDYLKGRDVVFVNACRNMWLMTGRQIRQYIEDAGARLVGHIVLQDKAPNLISALTIVRWLLYGKKEGIAFLPTAGVPEEDIAKASRFGHVIQQSLEAGALPNLQTRLIDEGAINYKPSVLFLEKNGHRMFGFWAKFIRKKGGFGDKRRQWYLDLFYYYLLFVLFVISPFGQLFFYLTYPLQNVRRNYQRDCLFGN